MEELQLDPITLLQLENDGFLVETKKLRGGHKFFQYHQDIEAFGKTENTETSVAENVLTTKQSILKKDGDNSRFVRKRCFKSSIKLAGPPDRALRSSRGSLPAPEKLISQKDRAKDAKNGRVHQKTKLKPKHSSNDKKKVSDISDAKSTIQGRTTRQQSQLGANTPAKNSAIFIGRRRRPNTDLTTSLSTACKESESEESL